MTEEEIQPLLNALGDVNILDHIMKFAGKEGVAIEHRTRNSAKTDKRIGVHYSGAHWYARMNDETLLDSYSSGFQIEGTAHFCQTFAVMLYTEKTGDLKLGRFGHNVEVAMLFLNSYIDFAISEPHTADWLEQALNEVGLNIDSFRNKIREAHDDAEHVSKFK